MPKYLYLGRGRPRYYYCYVSAYEVEKSGLNSINLNYCSQTCSTIRKVYSSFDTLLKSVNLLDPLILHAYFMISTFQ